MPAIRTIPITNGTTHAALLASTGASVDGGGTALVISGHTTKNNLIPSSANPGGGKLDAITIGSLDDTFGRVDFTIRYAGADALFTSEIYETLAPGFPPNTIVALQPRSDYELPYEPDLDLCPVSVEWAYGTMAGTIKETYRSFNQEIAVIDNVDPGFGALNPEAPIGRYGPRYTFLLSGTEYRIYKNYTSAGAQKPIAVVASAGGFPFPLRAVMTTNLDTWITSIMFAGNLRSSTIYSLRDQIADFGEAQTELHLKIYQKGKYPGTDGFPVYVNVYPDGIVYGRDDWAGWGDG